MMKRFEGTRRCGAVVKGRGGRGKRRTIEESEWIMREWKRETGAQMCGRHAMLR
jgi:hypothetical protein